MSTASDLLAQYLAAEAAVLQGQEYTIGDRHLRRGDLAEIRAERTLLESRVAAESRAVAGQFGPRHLLGDFS